MRILLTGGGTAGHVFPLLSVLEELKTELKDERLAVLYVGSRGGIEEEILKGQNIPSFFIYSGKWRRYWKTWPPALFLNLRDLFLIFIGFLQAFFIVIKARPDVIFAKGGYVTLPIAFASWFCRIPVISHESDIVMGLSNRICAKIAKRVCVSFPLEFYKNLPQDKMVYTGNPVRKEFLKAPTSIKQADDRKRFPTILITGGSQGSETINKTVYQILPQLLKIAKVVHLTGTLGLEEARIAKEVLTFDLQKRYFVHDFIEKEMPNLMREVDLIVSRSGANTLAEIAATGKASVLIPLKTAAADHQTKNARIFEQEKAAILISEDELNPLGLLKKIKEILKDKSKLTEMGERAKTLNQSRAAYNIMKEILEHRA